MSHLPKPLKLFSLVACACIATASLAACHSNDSMDHGRNGTMHNQGDMHRNGNMQRNSNMRHNDNMNDDNMKNNDNM